MSEVASSSKELVSIEGGAALPSPTISQSQRQGKNSRVDEDEDEVSYWRGELEKWRESGLKQVDYCREHNLDYNVFRRWKRKLYNNSYDSDSSITLVQVGGDLNFKSPFGPFSPSVGSSSSLRSSGIRFWLGEFCIEVEEKFSSSSLAQLIRTLRSV